MGEALITRKGGGGLKINNAEIVDYIGTNENIPKNSFVEFYSDFASDYISISNSSYDLSTLIELTESKYFLAYLVSDTMYCQVVSLDGDTVSLGTSLRGGYKGEWIKLDENHVINVSTSSGKIYIYIFEIAEDNTITSITNENYTLTSIYSAEVNGIYRLSEQKFLISATYNSKAYWCIISIDNSYAITITKQFTSYQHSLAYDYIVVLDENNFIAFQYTTDGSTSYMYVQAFNIDSSFTVTKGTSVYINSLVTPRNIKNIYDIISDVDNNNITIVYGTTVTYYISSSSKYVYSTIGITIQNDSMVLTVKNKNFNALGGGTLRYCYELLPHKYLVTYYNGDEAKIDANTMAVLSITDKGLNTRMIPNAIYQETYGMFGSEPACVRNKIYFYAGYVPPNNTYITKVGKVNTILQLSTGGIDGLTMTNITNGKGKIAIV